MTKTSVLYPKLWRIARALRNDYGGQDLIEYALIAGFVATALSALTPQVSESVQTILSKANTVLIAAASS